MQLKANCQPYYRREKKNLTQDSELSVVAKDRLKHTAGDGGRQEKT